MLFASETGGSPPTRSSDASASVGLPPLWWAATGCLLRPPSALRCQQVTPAPALTATPARRMPRGSLRRRRLHGPVDGAPAEGAGAVARRGAPGGGRLRRRGRRAKRRAGALLVGEVPHAPKVIRHRGGPAAGPVVRGRRGGDRRGAPPARDRGRLPARRVPVGGQQRGADRFLARRHGRTRAGSRSARSSSGARRRSPHGRVRRCTWMASSRRAGRWCSWRSWPGAFAGRPWSVGVRLFEGSPMRALRRRRGGWSLETGTGAAQCDGVGSRTPAWADDAHGGPRPSSVRL